jgi:hypothetical protein
VRKRMTRGVDSGDRETGLCSGWRRRQIPWAAGRCQGRPWERAWRPGMQRIRRHLGDRDRTVTSGEGDERGSSSLVKRDPLGLASRRVSLEFRCPTVRSDNDVLPPRTILAGPASGHCDAPSPGRPLRGHGLEGIARMT